MSETFMTSLHNTLNVAQTENGATAFATTNSNMLDLFAQGGALRNREESEALRVFTKAFGENSLLATRAMFYFRDARGGQGERDTFRKQLKWMASSHPDIIRKNLGLIPFYGRWDDLYVLFDTELESDVIELFHRQLVSDVASDHPSLLAKWLKSENTSSKESQRLAYKTRKGLKMSSRAYRKTLSDLREQINIIERLMSANEWEKITYEAVPSQANIKYGRAFLKHDEERRRSYFEALKKGEKKINASVLFPYEIVRKAREVRYGESADKDLVDALWNALPDYIGEKQENALAVVDVSGSMCGLPMDVAVSVGMYLAERNLCPAFHNKFLTFSSTPELVNITGTTLVEKITNMERANWEMNTDIQAVFRLILTVAMKHRLSPEEIPHKLYIISDMEFDAATSSDGQGLYYGHRHNGNTSVTTPDKKLFQTIAAEYKDAGYEMPNLVFWNVNARNAQFPMSMDERGFQMVSGCSPSIFQHTMNNTFVSAHDLMVDVLNSDRYQQIVV